MVGRVQTGGEAIDGVAGAWQLGELLGERHDAIPKLSDTFPGDPRVAKDRPEIVGEGDIDAARALVASTADAELFLYPGDQHYFADASLPSYRASAAGLLRQRVLEFLTAR
jgi:dienelactone hydrolase